MLCVFFLVKVFLTTGFLGFFVKKIAGKLVNISSRSTTPFGITLRVKFQNRCERIKTHRQFLFLSDLSQLQLFVRVMRMGMDLNGSADVETAGLILVKTVDGVFPFFAFYLTLL